MKDVYYRVIELIENDMETLVAKGCIDPCEYKPLGEGIDIIKDIYEIEGNETMTEEGSYDVSRTPRYNMRMSGYNNNRSLRTGRYTSNDGSYVPDDTSMGPGRAWEIRESYHDHDGTIKADLEELLRDAKSDHERMLIMRVMGKMEQK